MAGRIPKHFIDDLLARVDVVDVVGSRVKLKRSGGSNFTACCPFHNEKTPSFSVSQNKQFYHCFGCSAHGSAISFLMEYDGMSFVDAIESLAESIGVEVPREQTTGKNSFSPQAEHKPLYELMEKVAAHYIDNLRHAKPAIEYLKNRGLSGETAKLYKLGWASDGYDNLNGAFPADSDKLKKTGMLASNDRGNVYARFRARIMFPIRDRRGRTIGFGGRVLDQQEPKYLNSPETVLFHKGQELYGLFEARRKIQDLGYALVVEGYMDVVALAQHGVMNAVATLGTAPNRQHCETLYRTSPGIVFCFDGDRAGRAAAWRAAQAALPCLRDGRDAHFLFLPDGEDPDSLVSRLGEEGFTAALANKVAIIDYLFEHQSEDLDLNEVGGKARLVEQIKPLLGTMPDGVYRDLSIQRLEKLVGMPLKELATTAKEQAGKKAGNSPQRAAVSNTAGPPLKGGGQGMSLMRRSMVLLLNCPAAAEHLEQERLLLDQTMEGAPLLLMLLDHCRQQPSLSTGALLEQFRDDTKNYEILNKLATLDYMPDGSTPDTETATLELNHCIEQLQKRSEKSAASKLDPGQRKGLLARRRQKR